MNEITITTTQNVAINFNLASIGDRILAQIVDNLVKLAYIIVVFYLFLSILNLETYIESLDRWSVIAIYSLLTLPIMLYSLVQEALWDGQTVGKKLMNIKVIKIDGYQAGFGEYFMRWLLRIVELFIGYGIIGLIVMVTNKKNQRLGDMAAGTAVISLKNNININHTILQEIAEDYKPTYPEVVKLSDNDIRIIKETLELAIKNRDFSTIGKLKTKIIEVTAIKNINQNDMDFMKTVLKDFNFYTR